MNLVEGNAKFKNRCMGSNKYSALYPAVERIRFVK